MLILLQLHGAASDEGPHLLNLVLLRKADNHVPLLNSSPYFTAALK